MNNFEHIRSHLDELYGLEVGEATFDQLIQLIERYRPRLPQPQPYSYHQSDAILITYADNIQADSSPPLAILADFLEEHIGGIIPTVHLLPFYPFSSDDGFSVIDYKAVDPHSGGWTDVAELTRHFTLMFDAVINHISVRSKWFQRFLSDHPDYRDYFITVEPGTDLSQVFRPRALPLLTAFETPSGEKLVWTTFSEDQVDLNFENPRLLLDIIEVLLFYVQQGAAYIRLDAIAYLWKTIGTNCIHLPETHRVIQLFRLVFDEVAPQTVIITETNVPHEANISYFGDGANEAQMVYNFSLPPLVLHTIHQGDARVLTRWAQGLDLPSDQTTFFNFLASHDGIGVTPAKGLLSEAEIKALGDRVLALGGNVSFKNNADGTRSPYELNINYLDALGDPAQDDDPPGLVTARFILSQAIMLALRGVPGIYFHSLFGSRGWPEGVEETGRFRTINREKLDRAETEDELQDTQTLRHRVFYPYLELLTIRGSQARSAFSPIGDQEVLNLDPGVFAVLRTSPDGSDKVLCLNNVTNRSLQLNIRAGVAGEDATALTDLVSKQSFSPDQNGQFDLTLKPYQVVWLVRETTP